MVEALGDGCGAVAIIETTEEDGKSPVSLSYSLEIEFELCVSRKMIEAVRVRPFASLCCSTFRRNTKPAINCRTMGRKEVEEGILG